MLFGQGGDCRGYLVGKPHTGMKLMFELMNAARLEVGLQGVAVASASHQSALRYAKERIQSRHWQATDRSAEPVPIIEHPDIRRTLLTAGAYVQGMRALVMQTSELLDRAKVTEGEEAKRCQAYVELLTPLCKAWCSDWGFRVTEWCLQGYGGEG